MGPAEVLQGLRLAIGAMALPPEPTSGLDVPQLGVIRSCCWVGGSYARQRHRDTETERHRDTETRRHRDTETQRHRDTETQRHRDTERHRERKSAGTLRFMAYTADSREKEPRKEGQTWSYFLGSVLAEGFLGYKGMGLNRSCQEVKPPPQTPNPQPPTLNPKPLEFTSLWSLGRVQEAKVDKEERKIAAATCQPFLGFRV